MLVSWLHLTVISFCDCVVNTRHLIIIMFMLLVSYSFLHLYSCNCIIIYQS